MKKYMLRGCLIALGMASPPAAFAQETVTYTYDSLGRLVKSTVSGGSNNNTETAISYDPASNRTQYKVTNANGGGTPSPTHRKVVVVPLNGFTVIPIS